MPDVRFWKIYLKIFEEENPLKIKPVHDVLVLHQKVKICSWEILYK